ncbi:MAG: hypothetical protein ABI472_08280 [Ginsengibacter sp.]
MELCWLCKQYAFKYKEIADIDKASINEGEVYMSLMENDLVTLIQKIIETKTASWQTGWCNFLQ